MKRQTRIDDVTWKLFVRACGGRCCECAADGKLHQGHIQRHADGGQLVFENLIPLCKSCNAKHSRGFTRDSRPADWRDVFFKLFMAENGIALCGEPPKEGVNHIGPGQSAETTTFVSLESAKFVANSRYITTCKDPHLTQPISVSEARALLWDLFEKSKVCAIRPKRPLAKRQDQMQLLAIRNGRADFWIAGNEFLRESPCPWVAGDEGRGGYAQADSWQHFCESFDAYLKDGRARIVRMAEQATLKQESDRIEAAIGKEHTRMTRWSDYLRVAVLQPWPGISEEDRTLLAEVASEKAEACGEVRDVDDARLEESYAVFRRYKRCATDALLDKKRELHDKIKQCSEWLKKFDDERQQTFAAHLKSHLAWIDAAKTLEDFKYEWVVDELHAELSPNSPLPTIDF